MESNVALRRSFRGGALSFIDGDLMRSHKRWGLLPIAQSLCGGLRVCATIRREQITTIAKREEK